MHAGVASHHALCSGFLPATAVQYRSLGIVAASAVRQHAVCDAATSECRRLTLLGCQEQHRERQQ
jgi:hypothetical protein